MNQAIVVNNYSNYKQANGLSTTESSTSPELAKDRGSEKYTGNISKLDEFVTPVPTNYQTETVDFPDSPQYQQFNKGYFQDSKVPNSGGEMDTTAGASSHSNGDHCSQQGSLRHIPFSSEGITLLDSFSSDKEEYFEDDLVTGKLDSAFSISDDDMFSSDDEVAELSADQLELVAKQGLCNTVLSSEASVENGSNNLKNSHEILKALNSSQKSDVLERILASSNRDNHNKNEYNQNEGFLFGEKASDDAPDNSLVQKVRSCFDMDKIKDIYILSGRLQDILTPKEIEEIITHSEIYSEFIDDDVIEMLSVARLEKINSYGEVEKPWTLPSMQDNRKIIPALRNKLNMDVIDDIKIRAVFEDHKKSGEEIVATSHSLGSNHKGQKLKENSTCSPSRENIRAFFEESLVKSSSTLKKILPDNESLSSDIPSDLYHSDVFDTSLVPVKQPPTGILLNVSNLVTDSFPQHNCTPILKPDGTIELVNGKNKQIALETDYTIQTADIVNKTGWMQDSKEHTEKERPMSLNSADNIRKKKKISVNRDILASEEHDDQRSLSSLSNKSDTDVFSPADDLVTPEDIETPDDLDESMLECAGSSASEPIPEVSAAEELEEERSWKTCLVGGVKRKIDMKVIEPYKKVLSHGGYFGEIRNAIIIFSACYLPDRSRRDYDYVMDNLFLYVLITLDQLVAEDYVLVYLHGATQRSNMPSFGWLKRCYQMIDRRLRKNLKGLYMVHPTFWLKTIVIMTRPFVSSKFSRKLQFVSTLEELSELIPMDHVCIPSKVKELDFQRMIQKQKKNVKSKNVKPR